MTARISEPECERESEGASYNYEISLMILKYSFGSYTDDWIR